MTDQFEKGQQAVGQLDTAMKKLRALEKEISSDLDELEKMLG